MTELERWKTSLLHLPEHAFFAIIRNYLGPIKTPFNKHCIIDRLISFLKQKDTMKRIITLLDERDIEMLIPLYFLDDIGFDDLLVYFEQTIPFLELHRHIRNLEERLVLFKDSTRDPPRLRINPILRETLEKQIINSLCNAVSLPREKVPAPQPRYDPPWAEDQLLTAFLSLLLSFPDFFRADGKLRKKTEQELAARFPQLLETTPYGQKINLLLQAVVSLDLITIRDGLVTVSFYHWEELSALPLSGRTALIHSALIRACLRKRSIEVSLKIITAFLMNLLDAIPPGASLTEEILSTLVKVHLLEAGIHNVSANEMTFLLLLFGIFRRTGPHRMERKQLFYPKHGDNDESPLVIQADYTISVKSGFTLDKYLQVASLAVIKQYDLYSTYEITKTSFLPALRRGFTAEEIIKWLEHRSESPLPQNVLFSLQAWEKEYSHIALYRGIILSVSEEVRHFIEHTDFFDTWVKKQFGAGVYLLDPSDEKKWMQALKESGLEYVPEVVSAENIGEEKKQWPGETEPGYRDLTDGIRSKRRKISLQKLFEASPADFEGESMPLLDHLRGSLAASSLPPEMKEEYEARIENRLILFPDQLRPLDPRTNYDEAKGLDYMGKVRLIEHALHNKNVLLEIVERTQAGKPRSIVVKPGSLDQSGEDLLLAGVVVPGEEKIAVRVGKISLVRKVRGSLFS